MTTPTPPTTNQLPPATNMPFQPRMNGPGYFQNVPPIFNHLALPQAPPVPKKPQYHLLLTNIPRNVQDEYLYSEIKNACNIKSFKVPRESNHENKGRCYLELWNPSEVQAARKKLKATLILDSRMKVAEYVDK